MIDSLGTFEFTNAQRERFCSRHLRDEWVRRYPLLFDEDDVRITRDQEAYHFFEWLAAVLIYNTFGYLSLVEKYEFKTYPRKQDELERLVPSHVFSLIIDHERQCPDLLCYAPDMRDWFFCEVKGPGDRLRPEQEAYFQKLSEAASTPVRLIEFREAVTG